MRLSKGQYLSDILTEIPNNTILQKKIPGIGATTVEITSQRNSIIIVPNVPVIKGKVLKHENLLGVHEGITTEKVVSYLCSNKGFHKIMTTPESFPKIKRACQSLGMDMNREFFLLLDECHQLIKDVDYRADITLPMDDFFQFSSKALVSATPLEFSDPRFKSFSFTPIEADFDFRKNINVIHTNNTLQVLKAFIASHKEDICFFINSTDTIISIITQLNLAEDSMVFCAPKSVDKLKYEFKFPFTTSDWSASAMKKYSFFTGRFFCAFDLEIDHQATIVMLTDVYASEYTMLDVNTDCIQITGRFRNGVSSITHVYNTNSNFPIKTQEIVETELHCHEHAFNVLDTLYNGASTEEARRAYGTGRDSLPFNRFLYPDKKLNYYAIDNYINEEMIISSYNSFEQLDKLYQNSYYFATKILHKQYSLSDHDRIKLLHSTLTVKERRKQIVEILSHFQKPYNEADQDFINDIRKIDELIVEAYEKLGVDKILQLKFNETEMRNELILLHRTGNEAIQLIKSTFKVHTKYTCAEITDKLTDIFERLEITPEKNIKGKMITDYFQAVQCKKGKDQGYYLIAPTI